MEQKPNCIKKKIRNTYLTFGPSLDMEAVTFSQILLPIYQIVCCPIPGHHNVLVVAVNVNHELEI